MRVDGHISLLKKYITSRTTIPKVCIKMWNYRCSIYTETVSVVIANIMSHVELTEEQVREKLRDEYGSDVVIYSIENA